MPTPAGAAPDDLTAWRRKVDQTLKELASAIHNRGAIRLDDGIFWVVATGQIISQNTAGTKRVIISQGAVTPQHLSGGVWVND